MQALSFTKGKSAAPIMPRMDKSEIRRRKLRHLVDEYGASGLAKLAKKAPSYITVLLYPPDKKGAKNIGERTAELIEDATGRPRGWLSNLQRFDTEQVDAYERSIADRMVTVDDIVEQWNKLSPERQRRLLACAWDFAKSQSSEKSTEKNPFASAPAPSAKRVTEKAKH